MAGSLTFNLYELADLIEGGGDSEAAIVMTDASNAAERGLHLLTAFVAPLEKYHRDWTERGHNALWYTVDDWRKSQQGRGQREFVVDALVAGSEAVSSGLYSAEQSYQSWNRSTQGAPLGNHALRSSLMVAAATVDAQASAVRAGTTLYRTDASDLHTLADKNDKLLADQGLASARSIGDAIQYGATVNRVRDSQYGIMESEAELAAKQKAADAEDAAGKWSAIGNIVGLGASILSGGVI